MKISSLRPVLYTLIVAFGAALCDAPPALAQKSGDPGGAVTITTKEQVTFIIDRERTPERSVVLIKIMVPKDAKADSFMLEGPPRLVVDFIGLPSKSNETLKPPANKVIKQMRLGAHPEKLRIVMDLLTDKAPQYEWRAGPRQVTLRVLESGAPEPSAPRAAAEPTKAPSIPLPTVAPTTPPTTAPTQVPTKAPTKAPTVAPTAAPTIPPTATPKPQPTDTPKPPPILEAPATPTSAPIPATTQGGSSNTATEAKNPIPKLPDLSEQDLEAALDKEIAAASAALDRGEEIQDSAELEGEDLVDVPTPNLDDPTLDIGEEELEMEDEVDAPSSKSPVKATPGLITKDLPITPASQAVAPKADPAGALRANSIPPAPVVDFTIEGAEFSYLEPDRQPAFRLRLSKAGAQAQISTVDPTTYKIVISKCGLGNLGLALPQYPPADFQGLVVATSKTEGDTVHITVQVEKGVSLTMLTRDREIWIKKQ